MKKMAIVIVAFITATVGAAFHASVRAEEAAAQQAPAISSTGPAQSVWDGIYTEEQAKRGRALYSETCAACHAADLSGGEMAPALAGTDFMSNWNGLSVDDLFERIKVTARRVRIDSAISTRRDVFEQETAHSFGSIEK